MSDAQASFVATLDSSGIQSGAKTALSALEKLGQQIQRRSKDLTAMKAAQARLMQGAGVQEYLKRQKAIEKNEAYAAKMEKRLASAQENLDIAKQANVSGEDLAKLAEESDKAQKSLASVKEELQELQSAQDKLAASDAGVSSFRDQAKVIKANEAELADMQAQYNAAGGSAADLADEIKEPTSGIAKLYEEAKKVGGPIGAMGGILEKLGSMKMAGPLALVAVLIAIGAAAIKATIALVKFVAISADAARNAARARSNAAFGSGEGSKDISAAMAALRDSTAASKEEAQGLASELYRLGDRGARLEETALTIERFGQLGEDAKGAVKGLYEELRKPVGAVGIAGGVAKSMVITPDMLPRDVFLELANKLGKDGNKALLQGFTANKDDIRSALGQIGDARFGDSAKAQMLSLDKLSERLHENISSLFSGVKIGVFLGALSKLVGLLDESSESGQAIRDVLGVVGQFIADTIEAALPYIEAFAQGFILGALLVALAVIKIKNALSGLIPDSLTKNIDWLKVTFYTAAVIVIGLALAFGLLATAGFILALPFLTVVAVIVLIIVAIAMVADAIAGFFDDIEALYGDASFGDIATDIIDGLITGLKDGAADLYKAFADLAKGGYQAFKDAILSKSPSKLFRMAGQTIPQGVALGVEDETPSVETAVASMTSPADMVAPNGGGKRGGGNGINFIVQPGAIVIQGVSGADELEDEGFLRKLGRALVGAAREGGLSPEPETA
jgi:hypothetical protein